MFARPPAGQIAIGFARLQIALHADDLEIPPFGRSPCQPCALKSPKEAVALFLIHGPHIGQVVLRFVGLEVRHKSRLDGCASGEHIVLMNLAQFARHVCRGRKPTDFPARGMKQLPKAARDEGSVAQLGMRGGTWRGTLVVNHWAVHLIADQPSIGGLHGLCQRVKHGLGRQVTGGVVWAVEDDHSGAGPHGLGQSGGVHGAFLIQQGHTHHPGMVQFGNGRVQIVGGVLQHHFVSLLQQCGHGRKQHA